MVLVDPALFPQRLKTAGFERSKSIWFGTAFASGRTNRYNRFGWITGTAISLVYPSAERYSKTALRKAERPTLSGYPF